MEDLLAAAGLRKADVDRLGEAMRWEELTEERITAFRVYSDAFAPALASVVATLQAAGAPPITERLKTIRSTVAKLRRGTARLSQMQDIVGCRLVVPSMRAQNEFLDRVSTDHSAWRVQDRRVNPSHGYRAVHVIAAVGRLSVEVQIRTDLQHAWAELSEAWDRRIEGVKYGVGPESLISGLRRLGDQIRDTEEMDAQSPLIEKAIRESGAEGWLALYERVMTDPNVPEFARDGFLQAGPGPEGPEAILSFLSDTRAGLHTSLREAINGAFPTDTEFSSTDEDLPSDL
jgi:ppGpp synthetase/RelA/SpoT-type nucleotidyltranferase